MKDILEAYTKEEEAIILKTLEKIAITSNKTGKMLISKKRKILKSWEVYPKEAIFKAIEIYLKMPVKKASNGKGKNEKYLLGIMKNKAGELDGAFSKDSKKDIKRREHRPSILGKERNEEELKCDF